MLTVIDLDDGLISRVDVGERFRRAPCRIPVRCAIRLVSDHLI